MKSTLLLLLEHKLLWARETFLLTLAAAHIPAWLWLPLSGTGWLALHALLPLTLLLLLWFAWRSARREFGATRPVSWLALAAATAVSALLTWGLLSIVPVFTSITLQTASFVVRSLLAALLSTGLLLLPFAAAREVSS